MMDMIEQVKDAKTPEEMRAEIFRLSFHDTLVRSVCDAANYAGMSAEDRYTLMAYHALKLLAQMKRHVLDDAFLRPAPQMIETPNVEFRPQDEAALRPVAPGTQGYATKEKT